MYTAELENETRKGNKKKRRRNKIYILMKEFSFESPLGDKVIVINASAFL